MKILLDVSAVSLPLSGIGRYGLELARQLPSAEAVEEVAFLVGDRVQSSFDPYDLPTTPPTSRFRQRLMPFIPYKLLLAPYRRRRARALAASLREYSDYN